MTLEGEAAWKIGINGCFGVASLIFHSFLFVSFFLVPCISSPTFHFLLP